MIPSSLSRVKSRILALVLFPASMALSSCTSEPSSPSGDYGLGVSLGKSTAATDMTVGSVRPDSATQDTTLDVVINGSGFVTGTLATWKFGAVEDPLQVRTNSTRFVNSRQLVANITISGSASIGKWDIVVTAAGKKGGIGTEMFAIKTNSKPLPSAAPDYYIANDSDLAIRGDGLTGYLGGATTPYAGMSRYSNGECGVQATLWNSPDDHGSGDGTLATAMNTDRRCNNYPRKLRVSHFRINADGSINNEGTSTETSFINVAQIQSAPNNAYGLIYIPVGSSELRGMNVADPDGSCGNFRVRPVLRDGRVTGADQVLVTRTAGDTWIVSSLPDEIDPQTGGTIHHDKAWCETTGALYHLPVRFIIHNSVPLTP
jgi:hypothetical protein